MSSITFRGITFHSLREEIREQKTPTEQKTDPISRAEFKQIHSKFVKGEICAVCQSEITAPYYLTLSCVHTYCIECFTEWNRIGKNCPLCNMVTAPLAEAFEDTPEPPRQTVIAVFNGLFSLIVGVFLPILDLNEATPSCLVICSAVAVAGCLYMDHGTERTISSKQGAFICLLIGVMAGILMVRPTMKRSAIA